ncbi:MAG: aminoacetone oxidase family FAD-binding enzyme, partial [Desulfuromonas sp.]
TGCTGDGYAWAQETGHKVIKPEPGLVPVKLREPWTGEVSRFNLKNVKIAVCLDGKKIDERFGEAFFTRQGIGGPIILDMSSKIRAALTKGKVTLLIDYKPAVSRELFDKRLQREFAEHTNQEFSRSLAALLPRDMITIFLRLVGIDPNKKCHSVTRVERQRLLTLFKEMELVVTDCEGFSRAIITAGGVSLKDVDLRTMRSKKVANLFFAGEMLDLDGPTGGYNLQVCWSTGYLAGVNAGRDGTCVTS